jgi:hypothetical protein
MKRHNLASDQALDTLISLLTWVPCSIGAEIALTWHKSWNSKTLYMVRTRWLFFSFLLGFSSFGWAQLNSQLLLQSESFLSPEFEATNHSQYQFVGFNLRNSLDSEKVILDSEAIMAVGTPVLNYIKFREAAILMPNSPTQTLIIGRKKILWSEMDESWSLGTIEPAFKWNPLDRESHGLTGLFWVSQEPWLQFTAFVSPVFLPDQGPNFQINHDGHFAKINPWFQMPPKTFQPFPGSDASSDIQYKINKPPESEIIAQTSLGGSIEGTVAENFTWRSSYFYKPMNQLALAYDGIYNTGTNTGEVEILPQVGYHRVTAADLIYNQENYRFGISYMKDQPDPLKFDPEWTAPIFSTAFMYSTFFQFNFKKQMFKIEYLTMDGGKVVEQGEFANPDRAAISSRYPFREAVKGRYDFELPFQHLQKLKMNFTWTHSEKNEFDLIQLRAQYFLSRTWKTYADMELVKAKPLTAENSNEISPNANNDRFMLGMSYEL